MGNIKFQTFDLGGHTQYDYVNIQVVTFTFNFMKPWYTGPVRFGANTSRKYQVRFLLRPFVSVQFLLTHS